MYICTVTVACVFNILIIFSLSLSLLSLSPCLCSHLTSLSLFLICCHSHLSPFSSCLHYCRSNHASTTADHQTLTLTSLPFSQLHHLFADSLCWCWDSEILVRFGWRTWHHLCRRRLRWEPEKAPINLHSRSRGGSCMRKYLDWMGLNTQIEAVRERERDHEWENNKNGKRMNILLNKCVE